jgi:hypothetical protein
MHAGVQKAERRDALPRSPPYFERYASAHGMPGHRESRRRRRQHMIGHVANGRVSAKGYDANVRNIAQTDRHIGPDRLVAQ